MSEEFDDLYGNQYLAASDVKRPFTTTIETVEMVDFARQGERKKMKAVLTLKGVKKPLVVNKTNALSLSEAYGKDFDDWIDKRIKVQSERTQFGGKPVMGLRYYPINNEDAAALKAPKKKQSSDELNDELPDDL